MRACAWTQTHWRQHVPWNSPSTGRAPSDDDPLLRPSRPGCRQSVAEAPRELGRAATGHVARGGTCRHWREASLRIERRSAALMGASPPAPGPRGCEPAPAGAWGVTVVAGVTPTETSRTRHRAEDGGARRRGALQPPSRGPQHRERSGGRGRGRGDGAHLGLRTAEEAPRRSRR